jgi:hypothetical protein
MQGGGALMSEVEEGVKRMDGQSIVTCNARLGLQI